MTYPIELKTDASYKQDVGAGVSYVAEINGEGVNKTYQNSRFIEQVNSSTHSETVAVVYALLDLLGRVDENRDYKLLVRTDCEYTANNLSDHYPEQPHTVKTALFLLGQFREWEISWIPRATNKKADALARSKLMSYEEGIL